MTLDEFCADLATRRMSPAQQAVAVLLWHDEQERGVEMSVSELAALLHEHALSNPRVDRLRAGIHKLKWTIAGKSGGIKLRADSRTKVLALVGLELHATSDLTVTNVAAKNRPAPKSTKAAGLATPSLFIGTSVEGLAVGRAIHADLEHDCEPTVWNKGVFGPNRAPLHDLLLIAEEIDYAVLVFTPDDLVTKRGKQIAVPRDNVLFELGLFMGALGPERCFFIHQRGTDLGLPSDLVGLTTLTYPERSDGRLGAALQTACEEIRQAMRKNGRRPSKKAGA